MYKKALAVVAVILLAACGKVPTTSPTSTIDPSQMVPLTVNNIQYGLLTSHSASAFIDAATGGSVELSFTENRVNYYFRLDIPAGALSRSTEVTLTMPDPNQLVVYITPEDLGLTNATLWVSITDAVIDADAGAPVKLETWEILPGDVEVTSSSVSGSVGLDVGGGVAIIRLPR